VIANGAAARLVQRGDKFIILTYALLTDDELPGHHPQVVHVDDQNRVTGPAEQEVPLTGLH
jgi:aspartate 1-decarboxylase